MSATAEGIPPRWRPGHGDLEIPRPGSRKRNSIVWDSGWLHVPGTTLPGFPASNVPPGMLLLREAGEHGRIHQTEIRSE